MNFEKWALGLLAALLLSAGSRVSDRLDKIADQVAEIRADVAALKARESVALARPLP